MASHQFEGMLEVVKVQLPLFSRPSNPADAIWEVPKTPVPRTGSVLAREGWGYPVAQFLAKSKVFIQFHFSTD